MKSLLSWLIKICPKGIRNSVRGTLRWQPFFERLHEISLVGMNCGEGFLIEISGELGLLSKISSAYAGSTCFVIFDVGANVGGYSQAVLDVFGSRCQIHAFEPCAATAELFSRNMRSRERVQLHQLALADSRGLANMYMDSDGSKVATLNPDSLRGVYGLEQKVEVVPTMTLDQFCSEQRIERINLLKIDVEGSELAVLRGAIGLLAGEKIDSIQWEFGYDNVFSRVFFRDFYDLLSSRYHLFRIVKDGIFPLKNAYSCEIFRTTNLYARLKSLPPLA